MSFASVYSFTENNENGRFLKKRPQKPTSRLRLELRSKAPQAFRISTTLSGHAEKQNRYASDINLVLKNYGLRFAPVVIFQERPVVICVHGMFRPLL